MSASLIFVRDGRTLPFVPVTTAALEAIAAEVTPRRLAYARSLYLALLEFANEERGDRVAVTRKALRGRSGCSPELVSDLRPVLETAGVVVVHERSHGGQTLEHVWEVIEPGQAPVDGDAEDRPPVPRRHDPPCPGGTATSRSPDGGSRESARARREREQAAKRQQPPEGFPAELGPHLSAVVPILQRVAEAHDARAVWPLAVGHVVAAYPRRPLVAMAHRLEAWAVDPPRPVRDVVATYRTFLERERDLAGVERLDAEGRPASPGPSGVVAARSTPRDQRHAAKGARTAARVATMREGL